MGLLYRRNNPTDFLRPFHSQKERLFQETWPEKGWLFSNLVFVFGLILLNNLTELERVSDYGL